MAGCKQSQNDLATEAATGVRDKGQRDAKTAGLVRRSLGRSPLRLLTVDEVGENYL